MIKILIIILIVILLSYHNYGYKTININKKVIHYSLLSTTLLKGQIKETTVPNGIEKQRLDIYLANALPEHSRSYLSDLCEKGSVLVNDKPQSKKYKVSSGDYIKIEIENIETSSVEPENIPLDILYEDEHIIAINKPPGMVVHPAPGSPNNTFVNALLFHVGTDAAKQLIDGLSRNNIYEPEDDDTDLDLDLPETPEAAKATPISLRPGIVHRLDKGTSGVLIAGKHPDAVAKLSALFAQRKISKIYLAVCIGHPGDTTIVEPIGRSTKNRQLMTVYDGPPGKPAITHIRTLAFDGKISGALVRIETGRTHQIRVHLKERRTPIVGDEAYGNKDWNKKLLRSNQIHRPLLHAYETVFTHPFTNEQVILRAPIPRDISNLMAKLTAPTIPLINEEALLIGSTEVRGREPGEKLQSSGYVAMDRIQYQEEHWTTFDLPEEPPEY